jgi:PAS domain S-box-containing protein
MLSERRFHTVVEQAGDAMFVTDIAGNILDVNRATSSQTGYSTEELLQKKLKEIDSYYDEAQLQSLFQSLQYGNSITIESKHSRKDGSTYPAEVRIGLLEMGKTKLLLSFARDITERLRAEESLRRSEEKFRYIYNNAPVSIWDEDFSELKTEVDKIMLDCNDFEVYLNENPDFVTSAIKMIKFNDVNFYTLHMYKAKSKEEIFDNFDKIIGSNTESGIKNLLIALANNQKSLMTETLNYAFDGTSINIILNINFPESIEDYNRVLVTKTDITLQKMAEKELLASKEKAETLNNAKNQFLATISHELRTPLNGILGFSQILSEEDLETESLEMAQMINKSGQRLLKTVNQILDLTRIEANKYEFTFEILDFIPIISEVCHRFQDMALQKNLFLKTTISHDKLFSKLDETLFSGVIGNLIDNAIKYTNRGGINIDISANRQNGILWAVIEIKDSGIGIAEDKLDVIFEEFRQASEGYGRNFEGTGLGLSITKKYIELMNGSISVSSEIEKGSVFTVIFPAALSKEEITENKINNITPASYSFKTIDAVNGEEMSLVLLVEDEKVSQSVTVMALKKFCQVDIAASGEIALEKAKLKKYDLVLMDINLGRGLTGLETAVELKKIDGYSEVPIIALTAYAMRGDKEEFLAQGCSDYLSKPFDINELVSKVKKNLNLS